MPWLRAKPVMLDSAMECDLRQNRVKKIRAELRGGLLRSQGRHPRTASNVLTPARAPFSVRMARAETIESDYGGGSCGAAPAPAPPRRRGWEQRRMPQAERPAAQAARHRRERDPSDRFRTSAAAPRSSD